MNIVLVHPAGSNWVPGQKDITPVANRMPPLGLLSMAAWLEKNGHRVCVYDYLSIYPEIYQHTLQTKSLCRCSNNTVELGFSRRGGYHILCRAPILQTVSTEHSCSSARDLAGLSTSSELSV